EQINGYYAVYNRTTGAKISSMSDTSWWQTAGVSTPGGTSDPRVIYDPGSQRWFASAVDLANNNHMLLAVSATNNPSGTLHAFTITDDTTGNYFTDFPTLGLDAN